MTNEQAEEMLKLLKEMREHLRETDKRFRYVPGYVSGICVFTGMLALLVLAWALGAR